jgi:glycine cleavage system transcriptional repressor
MYHYLLWATGADKPGIVAAVTRTLFEKNCNIEESSMLRLGSEFAVLLIFSSAAKYSPAQANGFFKTATKKYALSVGVKGLSKSRAAFRSAKDLFLVSLHGADRPGLVYRLTSTLAKHRFNITDLITHRTAKGKQPGYILFVEGELPSRGSLGALRRELDSLAKELSTRIAIRPLEGSSI